MPYIEKSVFCLKTVVSAPKMGLYAHRIFCVYALEIARTFAIHQKMAPPVSATSCLIKKRVMCHAPLTYSIARGFTMEKRENYVENIGRKR